jgi:hypothetical protein
MTGRPLRAKDLVPVDLEREKQGGDAGAASEADGTVRFICPVSRYYALPRDEYFVEVFVHVHDVQSLNVIYVSGKLSRNRR